MRPDFGSRPTLGALAARVHQGRQDRRLHLLREARAGDDEPSLIVHRGERCFVMLNAFPYTSGHVMVAPYEHTADLEDLDRADRGRADARSPSARCGRSSAPTAPRATTSAPTWARSPAPASRTTSTCTSCPRWKGDTNFMPVLGDVRVLPESLEDTLARACAEAFDATDAAMTDVDPGIFKAYDVRGLYPDQIDEDVAYRGRPRLRPRARRPARARPPRRGAATSRSGTTCASTPPRSPRRSRRGLVDEGCHVLDIGMVGTEMVYYAVGSRELDGGVSVTASHNPKAVGRLQARARGRDRAVGRPRHPGRARGSSRREDFSSRAARGLGRARATSTRSSSATCSASSTPRRSGPMQVVLDGGNGMAGPMIGPILDRLPDHRRAALLRAERRVPRPRAEPAAGGEPQADHRHGARARAPSSASPGTATPTAASSSTTRESSCPGDFLTALLAESILAKEPGATILYDVRASRAVPDTVEARGRQARS